MAFGTALNVLFFALRAGEPDGNLMTPATIVFNIYISLNFCPTRTNGGNWALWPPWRAGALIFSKT
jgi:hypothetical protein